MLRAVVERVEGNIVQRAVRHDDEPARAKAIFDRAKQQVVECAEVAPRAGHERVHMVAYLPGPGAQRVDLEVEPRQRRLDLLHTPEAGHDLHAIVCDNKRQQLAVEREVGDQRRVASELLLQPHDVEGFGMGLARSAALAQPPPYLQHICFALARRRVERLHRGGADVGVAIGRPVDQAIQPIELLAQPVQARQHRRVGWIVGGAGSCTVLPSISTSARERASST